jgi:hypothetical protein
MPAPDGQTPYDFVYDKVTITSDRGGTAFDIGPAILEMSLFEHLWDSYMTGKILLADTTDLFQSIQFRGTEKIELEISFPNDETRDSYKKRFVITSIDSHQKGNDNAAMILFNIIEEHFYLSKIKKVNKAYDGKPSEILTQMVRDAQLDKTISVESLEAQSPFRYIVPWLTPIQAMDYITEKATTTDGLPYFLFSPIANEDELVFKSLEDILERGPITADEFIFSQMHTGKQDGSISSSVNINDPRITGQERSRSERMDLEKKAKTIEDYQHWNTYDLLSRVQEGTIGAKYYIRNANQFQGDEYHHGYDESLARLEQFLPANQRRLVYDNQSFDGIHSNDAARFYIAYLNVLYSDGIANPFDFEMQLDPNRRAIANSLRNNMKMDNIDIQVPGYHFFPSTSDTNADGRSIGRNLRLLFMTNDIDFDPNDPDSFIDKKLSGEYFITAAHHHFGSTRYTVSLTCSKYSELNE